MNDQDHAGKMNRRNFLRLTSAGAAAAAVVAGTSVAKAGIAPMAAATAGEASGFGQARRPNVILLMDDQNTAGLSKRYGYPFDTMPIMDRLASEAVEFTKAYCTMPACMPSRTSIFTGRWPSAHRVRSNYMSDAVFFERDIYDVAASRGYRTGLVGKNHTYLGPEKVDFWRIYNHTRGDKTNGDRKMLDAYERWLDALEFNVSTTPTPFPVEAQFSHRIVTDAIDFIDQAGAQPFFLEVSFPDPHDPEQVPAPYWDMFPPESIPEPRANLGDLKKLGYRAGWLHDLEIDGFPATNKLWSRYLSNYLGSLRMIDDQVGRLVDHLKARNLLDNTVIARISDHGDYLMKYGLARKGVGMPETLIHVPMFWSGPGFHAAKSVGENSFVSLADVMPTICEIMGAPIPRGVQGRSLLPLIRGEGYPAAEFRSIYAEAGLGGLYYEREDEVPVSIARTGKTGWDELNGVTQSGYQRMVRMGRWKLVYDMMGYGQFHDLEKDPDELENLFGDPRFVAEQAALMAELAMWTIRNTDSLPTGPQANSEVQFEKYQTKWATRHNWYAPYRQGERYPVAFAP